MASTGSRTVSWVSLVSTAGQKISLMVAPTSPNSAPIILQAINMPSWLCWTMLPSTRATT